MIILTIHDALRIMNVEIILIAMIDDVASGNRIGFRKLSHQAISIVYSFNKVIEH